MCKAEVLINGNSITPKNIIHNHSKNYKSCKVENSDLENVENSTKSHYMETNDNKVNGLHEEKEYDSTKKLFHFKEFINKKTLCDKATNTEISFCNKATNTEQFVRSIGVNTIESSFTRNKPRNNNLIKTGVSSENNLPQENYNTHEPDISFNKNQSFKNITDQKFVCIAAQDSSPTYINAKDSSIDYENWDDPNKLVDRLRVLVAEREAGFIGRDNEIQLIIEELRIAEIIY